MTNQFLTAARTGVSRTENGAKAYASTGKYLADQFGKASAYRGRDIKLVFADQGQIAGENPVLALRYVFYNRMVTRKVNLLGAETTATEKVQNGQGQRDESFKRFLYYAQNAPKVFYDNLWLMLTVGSFKDMWDIMTLAKESGIKLDYAKMFGTYAELGQYSDLSKKFMPQIRTRSAQLTERSKTRSLLAVKFRDFMGITNGQYRQLKQSGTAHEWQKLIANRQFDKINFGRIPGRALAALVKGKFLANQKLETVYEKWLNSQPVAKFTGYVYELYKTYQALGHRANANQLATINKQFDGLVELAKKNEGGIKGNVWCALDTSGSMDISVAGNPNLKAIDVCKSLGLFFSSLNTGAFKKNVIMFDSVSKVKQLTGSFTDMVSQIPGNSMGSTNFQSVINEIIRIRTSNTSIPLEDFPQTLIVVSDLQFDPACPGYQMASYKSKVDYTNHELAVAKLRKHFPSEFVDNFKFIWWDVTGRSPQNVPSTLQDLGTYVYSGFDGSTITMLLGGEGVKLANGEVVQKPTMEQMIEATLNQEVLQLATI